MLSVDVVKITIGKYPNIQDDIVVHGGDTYEGDVLRFVDATCSSYTT